MRRAARRLIVCLVAGLTAVTQAAPASLVILAPEDTAAAWRQRANITLSVAADQGLCATADFARDGCGWFRRPAGEPAWDLRAFGGLRLRVRGGGPGVHLVACLMTDPGEAPGTTFSTDPWLLDSGAEWTERLLPWSGFLAPGADDPIPAAALAHVTAVNLSITRGEAGSTQVWVSELAACEMPPGLALAPATPGARARLADDAAVFGLLDLERVPGLAPVRAALAGPGGGDRAAAAVALLAYMRQRDGPVYRFDPRQPQRLADAMRALVPTHPDGVLKQVPGLLAHEYTWEGETRRLQRPFDWVQKREEWSAVLNRLYYVTPLVTAYWYTGNEVYAQEVLAHLDDWIRACPPPPRGTAGRTWHPLEAGTRAETLPRLYLGVLRSPHLTPELNLRILRSLAEHARYLADPELRGGLPNMVAVESAGVASLGILFPEFRDAGAWRQAGIGRLGAELERRVLPDGAWEEVTPGYHGMVARVCLAFWVLAERNRVELPADLRTRFRSLYDWTLAVTKPDGHTPMLGDAGDGSAASGMADAALLFHDPGFRFLAPDAPPAGLLELFGPDAPRDYLALERREPAVRSVLLPHARLAVLRTGWARDDSYLLFDYGPIWSHTHQDTLGFELYALGQTLLWDTGVSNYNMPEARAYYRQARAHNVVLVDDADMRVRREGGRLLAWEATSEHGLVDAEAAFEAPDVLHRRQVVFLAPRIWVVRDRLTAAAPHRYERLFHVREKATLTARPGGTTARDGDGPVLELLDGAEQPQGPVVSQGLITYRHGGGPGSSNLAAPVVAWATEAGPGTVEFVTVLGVRRADDPETAVTRRGTRLHIAGAGGTWDLDVGPAGDAAAEPRLARPDGQWQPLGQPRLPAAP
jgi:hypothetical protein